MTKLTQILAVACLASAAACGDAKPAADEGASGTPSPAPKTVLRVGHFPNVTHAQGVIAHGQTRAGKGWFEERLGAGVTIEWFEYNAGPSAMEALLAGTLDLTYVGPSPALNTYVKSKGEEIRILRGAARGGAALVVQGDGRIKAPADFKGRKIATPQLGNTQDVAARAWLGAQGFKVTTTGGDVSVVPTPNPEQITLFIKGDLDAVWTVEPWVSRLEREAKGKVFIEEADAVTTVLVSSAKFLREKPELARKFATAHSELTAWIVAHSDDARRQVREELSVETHSKVSDDLLASCWPRLRFDDAIDVEVFQKFVTMAQSAGFLKDAGDLSRFVAAEK